MRKQLLVLALSLAFLAPHFAQAAFGVDSSGLKTTVSAGYGEVTDANWNIAKFVGTFVIQPVLGILGLVFFCLTIYAGMLWMTAQGDPKKTQKAKDILVESVIGAVIVVAAYAVTAAVFNALGGGSIVP